MADGLTPGILVHEIPGRESVLDAFPTGVAAFIGVTARGPVNEPVLVEDADSFERQFCVPGIELPLQQCLRDFFHSGGRHAAVVRITNGAARCSLRLPGAEGALLLEALSPGRREWLRASVDYDNLDPSDVGSFNLVVQRLRSPGTERVADQELFPRASIRPGSERYVADLLMESRLARVRGSAPACRPAPTVSPSPGHPVSWVYAADDGSDGAALTDYDLIGSSAESTGLFALDRLGRLDVLCLPPGPDGRPPGATLLLAALRYCRRRRALLLLEPPAAVGDADAALAWARRLAIAGENAFAVFPSLSGGARALSRPAAGAVAGALLREGSSTTPTLGSGFRPRLELAAGDRRRLVQEGINVLTRATGGRVVLDGDRSLAAPECRVPAWRSLSARKLSLFLEETLLQGTRWVVFEPPGPELARRLSGQLAAWLESLRFAGRLAGERRDAWFVQVDEPSLAAPGRSRLEFTVGFAPRRAGDFVIYRVRQGLSGARLAAVSPERWAIARSLESDADAEPDAGAGPGEAREAV